MTTDGNGVFKRAARNTIAAYYAINPGISLPLVKQKRPFCLISLAVERRMLKRLHQARQRSQHVNSNRGLAFTPLPSFTFAITSLVWFQ